MTIFFQIKKKKAQRGITCTVCTPRNVLEQTMWKRPFVGYRSLVRSSLHKNLGGGGGGQASISSIRKSVLPYNILPYSTPTMYLNISVSSWSQVGLQPAHLGGGGGGGMDSKQRVLMSPIPLEPLFDAACSAAEWSEHCDGPLGCPPFDVSSGNESMGQCEVPLSHMPVRPGPLVYLQSIRHESVHVHVHWLGSAVC